jgi:hypothetical protein
MNQGLSARRATFEPRPKEFLLHDDHRIGHIYPGGRNWAIFRLTRLPEKIGRPTERQPKGVLGKALSL